MLDNMAHHRITVEFCEDFHHSNVIGTLGIPNVEVIYNELVTLLRKKKEKGNSLIRLNIFASEKLRLSNEHI